MIRAIAVTFFALIVSAQPTLPAQPARQMPAGVQFVTSVEGITEYRLQNGLRVLLFPDPSKNTITVNITYMVGSRHEDYGETGMAHLLEHLLFKGSTNHPTIPKELQDHGARPNGTTWVDRTNYFETFQASDENLQWALSLEADRMVNSFIAKKDLDSEMTVVRNEFEAGENSPMRVLMERVESAAYLWHNYGKSTIGSRSDIERVPIERLQAFWRHFYQPDNAILVVAGKIDESKTLALVQQHFAPIPKPSRQLRRTYTAEPTQDGERSVTLRRTGDVQALAAAFHIPAGTHEEFPAIEVAASILGDAPSGRLHKALVETKKASSASSYAYQFKDPGLLVVRATVRMESSLEDARKTMLEVLDGIKTSPFTAEEVDRQKIQNAKAFERLLSNSQNVALRLSEYQAMGDWRMMFLARDRLQKVTPAQVQAAALKYLIPSNRTIGEFIPDAKPLRAEIPESPDVEALVKDYRGQAPISQGESFDASPDNIDKRTVRGELQGGLKLSFITKKTRGNTITVQLALHFGDEKNLNGQAMAAQMAGQMLMRGTASHTRQQIKDEFDRLKAQVAIFGSTTGATATIQTTRENLKPVLDLVAEILKEPSFPQTEFDQLKQQRLAGLESQKSEPQMLASLAQARHINSAYPKGDPRYVPPIEEQIADTKAITLDETKNFHKKFYGASNGELVIIGDVDAEAAQQQASKLLNNWPSGQKYTRVENKYAPLKQAVQSFEAPDKANAMWMASQTIQLKETDADYPAMVLGNYILGSGMNSRLFARIRGKEGLSYGVGANFGVNTGTDFGVFSAFAICAPQNTPKVEAAFKDELKTILEKGYSDAEVEAAKKSWLLSRDVSRSQDNELAGRMANQRLHNRTMAFDAELEAKVRKLTAAQIRETMSKLLNPATMNYFRAGDFKKAGVTW
ncbi:MAG: M16 family metallopeptidase [Bryobacteraceae bacterium]